MKLMGMKGWLDWSAWYFKFFVFMLISVAIMTMLFHVKVAGDRAVMNYTDPSVTFVFLLLFSLSVMTLCFVVSTLFSEEGTSCIVFSESMSCIVFSKEGTSCIVVLYCLLRGGYVLYCLLKGGYVLYCLAAWVLTKFNCVYTPCPEKMEPLYFCP